MAKIYQRLIPATNCLDCESDVYYDTDKESLIFTCGCGRVDPDSLPEQIKKELW